MKLIVKYEDGKPVFEHLFWGDHWPGCEKCRSVDLAHSATFANCCAQGASLLNEELIKRQIPVVQKQKDEVLNWAKSTGVFKT